MMSSDSELHQAVLQLTQGERGLRNLFHKMGYEYCAGILPTSDRVPGVEHLRRPAIKIAAAFDTDFHVFWFPLRELSPDIESRFITFYKKIYPYALYLFSNKNNDLWDISCATDNYQKNKFYSFQIDLNYLSKSCLVTLSALAFRETEDNPTLFYIRCKELIFTHQKKNQAYDRNIQTNISDQNSNIWEETVSWWLHGLGRYPMVSTAEEVSLATKIHCGDTNARDQLVLANLRLVVSIARLYSWSGIPLSDLIQEGNIGLITAATKFDLSQGYRFSTYATYWIRQAIGRSIENQGRIIRLPSHLLEKIRIIHKTIAAIEAEINSSPTPAMVANRLNVDQHVIESALIISQDILSLDESIAASESFSLAATLKADDSWSSPSAELFGDVLRGEIQKSFQCLTPREREVVTLRYGFIDGTDEVATLETIGNKLNLSRERVRQIEAGALQKLRRGDVGGRLKETIVSGDGDMVTFRQEVFSRWDVPEQSKLFSSGVSGVPVAQVAKIERKKMNVKQQKCVTSTSSHSLHLSFPRSGDKGSVENTIDRNSQEINEIAIPNDNVISLISHEINSVKIGSNKVVPSSMSIGVCQKCFHAVELKPTFNGRWYRCNHCRDTRVVSKEMIGS